MGKRRTEMKLIENQRARKNVFKKRRNGLFKKAEELSILCDIKLLIIIYDQDEQKSEIWPHNNEEAERIMDTFKQQQISKKPWDFPCASKNTRFGVKFSTSDHKNMINHYSENELQNLVFELDSKIASVVNLIQSKKILTEPKMLSDCQGTGFLDKGNEKEVVIYQEPVNNHQYQSFQTLSHYPNQNFVSYPEFNPSSSTSNIPFVPLPIHYGDPSLMQQPPNMNAIPSFHYVDPSLMQQPPNMNAIPSFHHVDPSLMQQPYDDPNIYHVSPFIYYPIMPSFPPPMNASVQTNQFSGYGE